MRVAISSPSGAFFEARSACPAADYSNGRKRIPGLRPCYLALPVFVAFQTRDRADLKADAAWREFCSGRPNGINTGQATFGLSFFESFRDRHQYGTGNDLHSTHIGGTQFRDTISGQARIGIGRAVLQISSTQNRTGKNQANAGGQSGSELLGQFGTGKNPWDRSVETVRGGLG